MGKPTVRPLIAFSILQLEQAFKEASSVRDTRKIADIARELECRSVPKAKKLLREVFEQIEATKKARPSRARRIAASPDAKAEPVQLAPLAVQPAVRARKKPPAKQAKAVPAAGTLADEPRPAGVPEPLRALSSSQTSRAPFRREPALDMVVPDGLAPSDLAGVLDAWIALEILSPPTTYKKPADLVAGDAADIAEFAASVDLPWLSGGGSRSPAAAFYHVVLGAIGMAAATARLREIFEGGESERDAAFAYAPIAILTLDREGKPVETDALAISSFAWGLAQALQRDLAKLGNWPLAEQALVREATALARPSGDYGEALPLTMTTIRSLFAHLVERLALPADLIVEPSFAIRLSQPRLADGPPAAPPLKSFHLGDLVLAKQLVEKGALNGNPARFLGLNGPAHRIDLRRDDIALSDAVAPARTPLGKWPAEKARPLALHQQAAVNLAINGEEQAQLLPINGAQEGGRTAVLRDVVVALVIERAQAMSELPTPDDAFSHAGKIRSTVGFVDHFALHDALKGFEMLAICADDEGVAEVVLDLQAIAAIDSSRAGPGYFKTVSDNVQAGLPAGTSQARQTTWGILAAALGGPPALLQFKRQAWDDEDFGLKAYLQEAAGVPQFIDTVDPRTARAAQRRKPVVVEAEMPPAPGEALPRWRKAQREFRSRVKEIQAQLDVLERGRHALGERLDADLDEMLHTNRASAERAAQEARLLSSQFEEETEAVRGELALATRVLEEYGASKPSFFRRLIGAGRVQDWNQVREELRQNGSLLSERLKSLEAKLDLVRTRGEEAEAVLKGLEQIAGKLAAKRQSVARAIDDAVASSGLRFADAAFFERPDPELRRDSPWLSDEINRLREDLFVAALDLHKAFIDAAAKPIGDNLDLLFRCLCAKAPWTERVRPFMPDLWATFFCVVPVVAATSASAQPLFGSVGEETLGWLLIDSAGQLAPRHVVGALRRTKRALVVGDPLQNPAATGLPGELAGKITEMLAVKAGRFAGPGASVQTLANAASVFGGTLVLTGPPEQPSIYHYSRNFFI